MKLICLFILGTLASPLIANDYDIVPINKKEAEIHARLQVKNFADLISTDAKSITIRRFREHGKPDTSFGKSGVLSLKNAEFQVPSYWYVEDIKLLHYFPNGDFILGFSGDDSNDGFAVRKVIFAGITYITAKGKLNKKFGNGGTVMLIKKKAYARTHPYLFNAHQIGKHLYLEGEINISGNHSETEYFITKLDLSGKLDAAFGSSGTTRIPGNKVYLAAPGYTYGRGYVSFLNTKLFRRENAKILRFDKSLYADFVYLFSVNIDRKTGKLQSRFGLNSGKIASRKLAFTELTPISKHFWFGEKSVKSGVSKYPVYSLLNDQYQRIASFGRNGDLNLKVLGDKCETKVKFRKLKRGYLFFCTYVDFGLHSKIARARFFKFDQKGQIDKKFGTGGLLDIKIAKFNPHNPSVAKVVSARQDVTNVKDFQMTMSIANKYFYRINLETDKTY